MHIINMTVKFEAHVVAVRVQGQAFTWTIPRKFHSCILNRPYTIIVWNEYGTSNFFFLPRIGNNNSVTGNLLFSALIQSFKCSI